MSLLRLFAPRFRFFDPGFLRDGELELVQPSHDYAAEFLRSVRHPACAGEPDCAVSAQTLEAFLQMQPLGLERPSARRGRPAGYRFWMRLHATPSSAPPLPIGGTANLRIADDQNTRMYYGHVGYHVFPPTRGRHLAERSVRLLLPLARRHGLHELWITTNPDNIPSRRTCERLGGALIDTVDLPPGHPLWQRGERQKCRYRLAL